MKNNQIYFNVKDGKVKVSFKENLDFKEFLTLISTGVLQTMNSIREATAHAAREAEKSAYSGAQDPLHSISEEAIRICTEELYDMYNAAASHTLALFAPDIEMRPHLTSQAIMEAEDKIIERLRKNERDNKTRCKNLEKEQEYFATKGIDY